MFYVWNENTDGSNLMFWVAIVLSVVCVLFVLVFIYFVMMKKILDESATHRYSLLLLGFSYFISIAILLGYGVGFHDRAERAKYMGQVKELTEKYKAGVKGYENETIKALPGLLMLVSDVGLRKVLKNNLSIMLERNAKVAKPPDSSAIGLKKANEKGTKKAVVVGVGDATNLTKKYRIWFWGHSAEVLIASELDSDNGTGKKGDNHLYPYLKKEIENNKDDKLRKLISIKNAKTFEKIVAKLKRYEKEKRRVLVMIVGLATKTPIKREDMYTCNYVLSQARASRTKERLIRFLFEKKCWENDEMPGIDIHINGASYDRSDCNTKEGKAKKECMSSEITLQPYGNDPDARSLISVGKQFLDNNLLLQNKIDRLMPTVESVPTLLDYMYFSIYTITTTAYGDIVPVSPQAKFVTILANIYEVVFLVILFNILAARPGKHNEGNGERGQGASEGIMPSPPPN